MYENIESTYLLLPPKGMTISSEDFIAQMHELVRKDQGLELRLDPELALLDKFVPLLASGQKTTTVRYAKGKIRAPQTSDLLLYETKADDKNYKVAIGSVLIPEMTVKSIGSLTEDDGKRDGFSGKDELVSVIEGIYGKVNLDELVSIYKIGKFDNFRAF